jgi:hypothetical protein
MRNCARCREIKDESEFKPRHRQGVVRGWSSYCILCEQSYGKTYIDENKPVFLYIVDYRPLEYCKIGVTQNLKNRLKDIRNVWPEAEYAALYDARCAADVEKGILKLLSNARIAESEVLRVKAQVVITIIDASPELFGCTKVPNTEQS